MRGEQAHHRSGFPSDSCLEIFVGLVPLGFEGKNRAQSLGILVVRLCDKGVYTGRRVNE